MVLTPSTMLEIGTKLPDFRLKDVTTGREVTSAEASGAPAVLVMFLCRHCPYVKHVEEAVARFANEAHRQGVAVFAVSSNDPGAHPEDSPEGLAEQARRLGFEFPYLFDADQSVAKAFRAACTPDFFLFDRNHRLAYRGQFDDSRPGNGIPPTGKDLQAALQAVREGKPVGGSQKPSLGCNIKWKPGNEPDYFRP